MINDKHHQPGRMVLLFLVLFLFGGIAIARAAELNQRAYIPIAIVQPTATPTPTPTRTPTLKPGEPAPPHTAPKYSTSYYMDSLDPTVARNLGCALGNADEAAPGRQEQLVVLDYGSPKVRYGEYGVSGMWRTGFASFDKVYESARNFGYGYWDCVDSDFDSHLRIAVGTSNYPAPQHGVVYPSVTYGHGQAFAQMINRLDNWFTNVCTRGCDGQISIYGANDIEPAWDTPAHTLDWMNGYDSANARNLYNYGSLDGCPRFTAPGANCANGWTKEHVMRVTTGYVSPLPEIYATNGVNAEQWYLMSLYAYQTRGKPFDFVGVMTNWQACQQSGDECKRLRIDNTPAEGWTQLYNLVNKDARTVDSLTFSTDIKWLNVGTTAPSIADPNGHPLKQSEPLSLELQAAEPQQMEIEEGIYEGSGGLISNTVVAIQNGWEGERNGTPLRVLAGTLAEDPALGLLVVIDPLTSEQPGPHFYAAPEGSGSLRIVEVQETQVVLQTNTGQQILFDLVNREYR